MDRDDYVYVYWTREFYRALAPHAGVLVMSRAIPPDKHERPAHALLRWVEKVAKQHRMDYPGPYCIDFLGE